jgi:hypothetical protein
VNPVFDRSLSPVSVLLFAALVACGGGGGGADGGDGPVAPPPSSGVSLPQVAGLISVVGGDGEVQLSFQRPPAGLQFALFAAADSGTVFGGAPLTVDPAGTAVVIGGQPDGQVRFYGLGVRAVPQDPWSQSGPVLAAHIAAPVYVDPSAAPGGDGLSPATAFADPVAALVSVSGSGGNVWLRAGTYGPTTLTVFGDVFLSGGFAAGFDLADRNPVTQPSVVRGSAGVAVLAVVGTSAVIDGVEVDGRGVAEVGIDCGETALELRSVVVRDCATRGIRLRAPLDGGALEVELAGCESSDNGGDGLSGQGVLELDVFASRFERNVQEGLDLDDLLAAAGGSAQLSVIGSAFESNGAEGVDVDLATPLFAVSPGGEFRVTVRDSLFATNGLTGLLVDVDYESTPAWALDLEVTGSVFRGNGGPGARLDLDSTARAFVHRSRFAANGEEGLVVSSESAAGIAVVSSSAFVGNGAAGLRANFGNVPVLASHCVFSGNVGGGFLSDTVTSTAASSLLWLEPTPISGVSTVGQSIAEAGDLERVAEVFLRITAGSGTHFAVDSPGQVTLGVDADLAGDGVAREIAAAGADFAAMPAPAFLPLPTSLALFGVGSGVAADHRLAPGATVTGEGFVAPGAAAVDPGPWGSPDAGEPGLQLGLRAPTFRLAEVEPAPVASLGAQDLVRMTFDSPLAAGSANSGSVHITDGAGVELSAAIAVVGGVLELTAPPGGWPATVLVGLDRGLESTVGVGLTAPVRVRFGP